MARDQESISLGKDWQELTNAAATHASYQVVSGTAELRAKPVASLPTDDKNGFIYRAPQGEADCDLERHFAVPGARHLFGRAIGAGKAEIVVSHANA